MNCLCSEPCKLWQELQDAKDKYDFVNTHCLPDNLAGNYTWFPKEVLKCSACCLGVVREAGKRGEITLTVDQDLDIIEKFNRSKYYYQAYDELHPCHETTFRKLLMRLKRWVGKFL